MSLWPGVLLLCVGGTYISVQGTLVKEVREGGKKELFKCSPKREQINKLWYAHTKDYYTAVKN